MVIHGNCTRCCEEEEKKKKKRVKQYLRHRTWPFCSSVVSLVPEVSVLLHLRDRTMRGMSTDVMGLIKTGYTVSDAQC